ncbi:hypothetical protein STRIP9103_01614, partial [Streptomyces ipomoeae 91-03]
MHGPAGGAVSERYAQCPVDEFGGFGRPRAATAHEVFAYRPQSVAQA